MKTIYKLFTILGLALPFTMSAQQGFHIGANFGGNATGIIDHIRYGDADYDPKFAIMPTYGIEFGNNWNKQFGFQVEANMANLGQEYVLQNNTINPNRRIDLNYVQIPVLFKYMGGDRRVRFTAMAGPQWSALTGAKYTTIYTNTNGYKESGAPADVKTSFKSTDFGILVSTGSDVSLYQDLYASFEARFYYGLMSINKASSVLVPYQDEKLGNVYGGLNFGLHYIFGDGFSKEDKAPANNDTSM